MATITEKIQEFRKTMLDIAGIKPETSLFVKSLTGKTLSHKHFLPVSEEREFIQSYLQLHPEIPAVNIERVQFPNDLSGSTATDLQNAIIDDRQDLYQKQSSYIFDSDSGFSYSQEEWKNQILEKQKDNLYSEYLIAVREKNTKELLDFSKCDNIDDAQNRKQELSSDSKEDNILIYMLPETADEWFYMSSERNMQRFIDDPRNGVKLINDLLVFTNVRSNSTEIYTGESMLMDFYEQNYDKTGIISICSAQDIETVRHSTISNSNMDLNQVPGITLYQQFFAPEVNFFIKHASMNIDYDFISHGEVKSCIQENFADYRYFLQEQNITDIERSKDFVIEAIKHNETALDVLSNKEKPDIKMWQELLESPMTSAIDFIPKELITFELLEKVHCHDPYSIYKHLSSNITSEQIVELIDKDLNKNPNMESLNDCISCIPKELQTPDFLSALHKKYDESKFANELAYRLVVFDIEINNKNAQKAMEHFSSERFMTEYDPVGTEDCHGRACGCDLYINGSMLNPAEKFESNLLSIKQWHDITAKDTRIIYFIPESVTENESFWENYQDFIQKGGYLNHPNNKNKMDKFDEYEVFHKMPMKVITNPDISRDLLERKAIGIRSIARYQDPTEELYRLLTPEEYFKIPIELREKETFKDIALAAFEKDNWNIEYIPEKFITKEMVSSALSYNMELVNQVPIHLLTEEMLVDKIKNSNNQGVFKDLDKSSYECSGWTKNEISEHKAVLRYIPEKLRTEKVCKTALFVNPKNAQFLPNHKKEIQNISTNKNTAKQIKEKTIVHPIKQNRGRSI